MDCGWLLRFALQWRQSHRVHVVASMHVDDYMSMALSESMCWRLQPFGETVEQVFARLSAMRDRFDGPPVRCQCQLPALACQQAALSRRDIYTSVSHSSAMSRQLKPLLFVHRS